ncbi:MAG TPA: MarC family protein [Thermoanaerobaculia bacterium]|nr:MarC family protein [Thermoanaerobaculia bacterium]
MPLSKVVLLSFITLFTMVNPLAVIPSFVALTDGVSRRGRAHVALIASLACIVVLTVFLVAGNWVFQFFGITVPAFQIMGGIIFFSNALRTLVEQDDRRAYNIGGEKRMADEDVEKAEIDPASIAVVPLAIPMLSGPGAITSTMVLVNLYPRFEQKIAVIVAIFGVGVACYALLLLALPLSRFIGDRGRAVFTKIMSLLLGAIGVQFIINGLKPVLMEIIQGATN